MKIKRFLTACALGAALGLAVAPMAPAETLRVMSGSTSAPLSVPMNRAVVVGTAQETP